MSHYNTILSEMLHLLPRHQFETLVNCYQSNRYVKKFNCWHQLVVLLYAQASGKQSLRDIQYGFTANNTRLYHLGLPEIKRSTMSDANAQRDYQIFEGLFYKLLERCKDITPKHRFKFKNPLYSLDATVIDLCLEVFSWARFRQTKGAIKLHYQFDHAGHIPNVLVITDAKQHELTVAKKFFDLVPDSIYCMDKGYTDFGWFRRIHDAKAFFVTRAKDNLNYRVIGQHNEPNKKGVLSDELIALQGFYSNQEFPGPLRLAAFTIAQIYKARWQIEIFFKWIKQNLKIKTFLGTSRNAVLTQIWVAMCYYLLLAYIKYQGRYKYSLFYLHRMVRETLLSRCTLIDLLRASDSILPKLKQEENQLMLL